MNSPITRRVVRGGVVLTALSVVAISITAATGLGASPKGSSPSPRSGLPPSTATVTRTTLVDTESESGALGHGDVTTISGRLTGTVTELPAINQTISRGRPVYRIDNTPVTLLYGTLPAYRTLSDGMSGDDVRQFEQNLWALGYHGFTVDDDYTWDTAQAVRRWQKALGLAQTGSVDPGRIVYAPSAIRVDAVKATVGGAAGPGQPVLDWTGRARVATTQLDVSDEELATPGSRVKVELPDGSTVAGTVASSSTVVVPADATDAATTKVQAIVALADQAAVRHFDSASVTVDFTAATRADVLAVPVAALLALSGGGYGLQVVSGGTTRILPVQTGLFANDEVEVSGSGLSAGLTVGVAS